MTEKKVEGKYGNIHIEVNIDIPSLKNIAEDGASFAKNLMEGVFDIGKKILFNERPDTKENFKKINIK